MDGTLCLFFCRASNFPLDQLFLPVAGPEHQGSEAVISLSVVSSPTHDPGAPAALLTVAQSGVPHHPLVDCGTSQFKTPFSGAPEGLSRLNV